MNRNFAVALAALSLVLSVAASGAYADDTAAPAAKPAHEGPLRKLHNKIRNMRPLVKHREAKAAKAAKSSDKANTGK